MIEMMTQPFLFWAPFTPRCRVFSGSTIQQGNASLLPAWKELAESHGCYWPFSRRPLLLRASRTYGSPGTGPAHRVHPAMFETLFIGAIRADPPSPGFWIFKPSGTRLTQVEQGLGLPSL